MTEPITPADAMLQDWNPSAHLNSSEAATIHLRVALEEGDPALVAAALGDIARARGLGDIAEQAGLARTSLYRSLGGKGGRLNLETVLRLIDALGLKLTVEPRGDRAA